MFFFWSGSPVDVMKERTGKDIKFIRVGHELQAALQCVLNVVILSSERDG